MTTTPASTQRADYIQGLRMLADLLEDNPDVDLPFGSGNGNMISNRVTIYHLSDVDAKDRLARFARLLPGKVEKQIDDDNYRVHGKLAGLNIEMVSYRSNVCERVVTGVETVTRMVPDPAVDVPLVEVTERVETVDWVCEPLLGTTTAVAS